MKKYILWNFLPPTKFFPLIKTQYLYCELNSSRRVVSVFPAVSQWQFFPVSFSILPIFPPSSFIFEPRALMSAPCAQTKKQPIQFWRIAQCADFPNFDGAIFHFILRVFIIFVARAFVRHMKIFMRGPGLLNFHTCSFRVCLWRNGTAKTFHYVSQTLGKILAKFRIREKNEFGSYRHGSWAEYQGNVY